MSNVGGDLLNLGAIIQVTAGANLADKTLVDFDGTVPSSAARCTGGVVVKDTASGDYAAVKIPPGIYEVVATDTVTAGSEVEAYQGTVYGNIANVSTAITAAGVKNLASGYPVGRALTGGSAGDTVLVNLYGNQSKSA